MLSRPIIPQNSILLSRRQIVIENIKTSIFPIRIYGMERTVCDVIRMRHIVGEDIAMEGLNNYIKKTKKDINKMFDMAKFCRVKHIIEPAVKAMIGF